MKKRVLNLPAIILSVFGIFTLGLLLSFIYLSVNGRDYSNVYIEKILSGEIKNPILEFQLSLSGEEPEDYIEQGYEIIKIDEEKSIIIKIQGIGDLNVSDIKKEIINYASITSKVYNLHAIPFTKNIPKIQVYINGDPYYVKISKGNIIIEEGITKDKDIIIRTTYDELLKMIEDKNYLKESVSSGETTIEITKSKVILFSKGYLTLYKEFAKE